MKNKAYCRCTLEMRFHSVNDAETKLKMFQLTVFRIHANEILRIGKGMYY